MFFFFTVTMVYNNFYPGCCQALFNYTETKKNHYAAAYLGFTLPSALMGFEKYLEIDPTSAIPLAHLSPSVLSVRLVSPMETFGLFRVFLKVFNLENRWDWSGSSGG